ncbi:hypothetical protein D3C75_971470 [compost metagenome]
MQCKLGQILRNQRDHAGIMRAWGDLAENHFIAADEQLDAEQAKSTQCINHLCGDRLSTA